MIDRHLLDKYAGQYPRYTSYPTALEFKNLEQESRIEEIFERSGMTAQNQPNISLYIHLPFCPSLCYFCACNKIVSNHPGQNKEYLNFLEKEFRIWQKHLPVDSQVLELHLGGGSPSFLSTSEYIKLYEIFSQLNVSKSAEKSIEADPRNFDGEKLNLLYDLGFRRFSLGVQDFDEKVQKTINRIQPHRVTVDLVREIRLYRGTSVNLDLIYGLPEQTLDGFQDTIAKVIEMRPDRLALYGYAHVNWRTKVQNVFAKHKIPTLHERAEQFLLATELLEAAGYLYIGLDHFALPTDDLAVAYREKKLKRNFMGYTKSSGDYLIATGLSSISDIQSAMIQNTTDLDAYQGMVEAGRLPIEKIIRRSENDTVRSFIIERIMCQKEIGLDELHERFENTRLCDDIFNSGIHQLQKMEIDGLVELANDKLTINAQGNYFLRQIAAAFDSYLQGASAQRAFSRV